ncbi:MAG: DUF6077 domain-containing protein [Lachnospiraceae bacterium]|nr:DUF6077 domain-containing protein [Lachnospiraceae bacterium]
MIIVKPIILCLIVYLSAYILGKGFFPGIRNKGIGMSVASGICILWALFLVVCLPCIFLQKENHGMDYVMIGYSVLTAVFLLISAVLIVISLFKKKSLLSYDKKMLDRKEIIYLALFLGIILFQLYKSVFYAYSDGDDAYYIAVSQSIAGGGNSLYWQNPYTGQGIDIAYRYALAPFPVWIAYLARLFDVNAAIVAHICMPLILIPVTYVIYNAISLKLFGDNSTKRYMFLCLLAIFVLFAHYSMYSPEFFMLARTRQGKEALGNIIIPFLLFELVDIAQREKWHIEVENVLMMFFVCVATALTSVFGNLLILIVLFGNFVYSFIRKGSWKDRILISLPGIFNLLIVVFYILK